ncbi:hypothetical protein ACIG87_25765 [Micromonospora sp. NPDC051925]|uniref:hypothetical protein n=1 Tax=Micromonospora sp. NPDC051925 TaxID=3364288 RepID=UPI0037C8CD9F
MAGRSLDGAPANYDGGQVTSMHPIDVYEATFYRQSYDAALRVGGRQQRDQPGLSR